MWVLLGKWLLSFGILCLTSIHAEDISPLESLKHWNASDKKTKLKNSFGFSEYYQAPGMYSVGWYPDTRPGLFFNVYKLHQALGTQDFDYEKLKAWIKKNNVRSTQELLKKMKADPTLAPYVQHRVYVYKSLSAQRRAVGPGVKQDNGKLWRSIHYHPKGKLVFAFTNENSDPNAKKCRDCERFRGQIEIMEVGKDFKLSPHILQFHENKDPSWDDNPSSCARCHGEKQWMRFNSTGLYNTWSGLVAGLDDHQGLGVYKGEKGAKKDEKQKTPSLWEHQMLEHFWKNHKDKGTFQHSPFPKELNAEYPLGIRANLMFHQFVHALQYQKLARILTQSKLWDSYKYALFGVLNPRLDCGNATTFVPPKVKALHEKKLGMDFEKLWRDTRLLIHREAKARIDLYAQSNKLTPKAVINEYSAFGSDYESEQKIPQKLPKGKDRHLFTSLRYLLEGQGKDAHMGFQYWSIAFRPKGTAERSFSYSFDTVGTDSLDGFFYLALRPYFLKDPQFRNPDNISCEWLRSQSHRALRRAYNIAEPTPRNKAKTNSTENPDLFKKNH